MIIEFLSNKLYIYSIWILDNFIHFSNIEFIEFLYNLLNFYTILSFLYFADKVIKCDHTDL